MFEPEHGPAIPWGEFRQPAAGAVVLRDCWAAVQLDGQFMGVDLLVDPRVHDDHFLVAFDMIASIQIEPQGQ